MMKKLTLFLLLTIFFKYSFAQYNSKENSVWIFGSSAGLDFSTGVAVPIERSFGGSFGVDEGSASVSDANGNLLFYAGGDSVYNKNGQTMPNGYRVMGLTSQTLFPGAITSSSSSATQAMLIVPVIGNSNQYYLFAVEGIESWNSLFGGKISYSIVDMTLDNGKGDVVPATKATVLDSGYTEKMIAVAGDNCNMWLLGHTVGDEIRAFEITSAGINTTPVVSTVGYLTGNGLYPYQAGVMKISPSRKKLAITSLNNWQGPVGVEVCDFDPATGIVSNAMVVDSSSDPQQGYYGAAFSPDNTKLYVAGNDTTTNHTYSLRQYDISLSTRQAIVNSKYDINAGSTYSYGKDMKLAPDGKIYVANVNSNVLGVIAAPNASGAACNFNINGITLLSGTTMGSGLPNEYVKPLPPDTTALHAHDTTVCVASDVQLHGRSGYAVYKWNTGATDTAIIPTQAGTYWVLSSSGCHSFVDTFVVTVAPLPPVVISVNGFELSVSNTYSTYQWYLNGIMINGATSSTYTVTTNGTYCVKVTNALGCSDSTACKTVSNVGVLSVAQIQNAISIYPNPATNVLHISSPVAVMVTIHSVDGKEVLQANTNTIDISKLNNGLYIVTVTDKDGTVLKNEKLVK